MSSVEDDSTELVETTGPESGSPKVGRRDFMRIAGGAAVTAGAAASAPPKYSPIGRASAIAPLVIGGAVVAGAALGYLTGEVADHYLGPDGGELTGTEEDQDLYQSLKTRLVEMKAANDTVLTVISNRAEDSQNVAWPGAKKEVVKAFNNGETETAATTAGETYINDYYTTIQKNFLNRWIEVLNKIKSVDDLAASNSNVSGKFGAYLQEDSFGSSMISPTLTSVTANLADGAQFTFKRYDATNGPNNRDFHYDPVNGRQSKSSGLTTLDPYRVNPWDTGSTTSTFDALRWGTVWNEIDSALQQMRSNISTYTTQLYQNYSPGDIDPSMFLDPMTLASELSTDYGSTGYHAYAAAEAAVLGVPGDFDHSLTIELMDSGITVQGSLWTDWAPVNDDGSTTTTTTTDTNTTATTTETSTTSGFVTGTVYDPADTNKDVFISFEYSGDQFIEGADVFVQDSSGSYVQDGNVTSSDDLAAVEGDTVQVYFGSLTEPFKVKKAVNVQTGESVSTVTLESKNHQTAEVSLTEEQLQLLTDIRKELRENEETGGGGGGFNLDGFSFGGIPGEGVLLVAAGVGAWLLGGKR